VLLYLLAIFSIRPLLTVFIAYRLAFSSSEKYFRVTQTGIKLTTYCRGKFWARVTIKKGGLVVFMAAALVVGLISFF